jgi:hypothetical protein
VPQEPLEDDVDVTGRTKNPLDSGATAPEPDDREISDRGVAGPLAVDDDGDAAFEVRLADEELAPAGQLADDGFNQRGDGFSQRGGRRRACGGR